MSVSNRVAGMNEQTLRQYGKTALKDYHNALIADNKPSMSQRFNPFSGGINPFTDDSSYTKSFEILKNEFVKKNPNGLLEVGEAVAMANLGVRRLSEAMQRSAQRVGKDKIPSVQDFITGITQELESFDFSIFGDVALSIADDVTKGSEKIVENVGGGLVGASAVIRQSKFLIPVFALVALFLAFRTLPNMAKALKGK